MSKLAAYAAWGGLGTAGAIVAAVATGALDLDTLRRPAPEPAVLESAAAPDRPQPAALAAVPAPDASPAPDADPAPADKAAAVAPEQAPVADTGPAANAAAILPVFDLVRVEPEGMTLVAGKGAPAARVEFLIDGTAQAEAMVGTNGAFTGFLDLPPLSVPRVLTLRQTLGDSVVLSPDEVIIAPMEQAVAALEEKLRPEAEPADAGATPVEAAPVEAAQAELVEAAEAAPVEVAEAAPAQAAPVEAAQATPVDAPSVDASPADAAPVDVAIAQAAPQEGAALAPEAAALPEPEVAAQAPEQIEAPSEGAAVDPEPGAEAAPPVAIALANPGAAPAPPAAPATAPTVLLNSARGIEVLQTAPLSPGDVALDAISYDDEGDVLLSGRGDEAAFVRVYLDNTPITASRIREDGRWRITLPQVDTGTYTLRVDQLDEAGIVTARVESPFLRESPEVLEAATTGDGPIRNVTVQPGATLWAIARDRYGEGLEYVRVFDANRDRIRNPDLIYPGQIFDLPED